MIDLTLPEKRYIIDGLMDEINEELATLKPHGIAAGQFEQSRQACDNIVVLAKRIQEFL